MTRSLAPLALAAAALASPAHAQSVAAWTTVDNGPISAEAFEAVVWHALFDRHGHRATLLDANTDPVGLMEDHDLAELYGFTVRWRPHAQPLDGHGTVAALSPRVEMRRFTLGPDGLQERARYVTWGRARPTVAHGSDGEEVPVAAPLLALQDAVDRVVASARPPVWQAEPPSLVRVPIEVVADEEYRDRYGPAWRRHVDVRLERASALLHDAGLALDVVWHDGWTTADTSTDLSALLADLHATPRRVPGAIRVAFTAQVVPAASDPLQDVGRAYLPGRDLIVADQPAIADQPPRWDEAEEATVLAHEVLHALGAPHLDEGHFVMSSPKSETVHRLAPSTRALAHAAARARFLTQDEVDAATLLGGAAEAWLGDAETQLAYVRGNLALGPGLPAIDDLPDTRASALVIRAVQSATSP